MYDEEEKAEKRSKYKKKEIFITVQYFKKCTNISEI